MISWLLEQFLSSIPSWVWLFGAGGGITVVLLSGILSHVPAISIYARFLKPVEEIPDLILDKLYNS